ncbi:hypothetical protein ACLOJK_033715 [Asimina triloba]
MSGQRRLNAGITVQILTDVFNIRGIVHYGTAGSSNSSLSFGDVSVPKFVAFTGSWQWMKFNGLAGGQLTELSIGSYNVPSGGENLLSEIKFKTEEFFSVGHPMEEVFWLQTDPEWFQIAQQLQDLKLQRCVNETYCLPQAPKVVIGLKGATADIFVDNAAYGNFLFQKFQVSTVDEESSAVVMTAMSTGLPSIVVRGVSDLAGGDDNWSSTSLSTLASSNSLAVAVEFIRLIRSEKAAAAAGPKLEWPLSHVKIAARQLVIPETDGQDATGGPPWLWIKWACSWNTPSVHHNILRSTCYPIRDHRKQLRTVGLLHCVLLPSKPSVTGPREAKNAWNNRNSPAAAAAMIEYFRIRRTDASRPPHFSGGPERKTRVRVSPSSPFRISKFLLTRTPQQKICRSGSRFELMSILSASPTLSGSFPGARILSSSIASTRFAVAAGSFSAQSKGRWCCPCAAYSLKVRAIAELVEHRELTERASSLKRMAAIASQSGEEKEVRHSRTFLHARSEEVTAELLSGIRRELEAGRLTPSVAARMEEVYENYQNASGGHWATPRFPGLGTLVRQSGNPRASEIILSNMAVAFDRMLLEVEGHNIILISNHQTEADPAVISLLLHTTNPHLPEKLIYIAGDRVVTDPVCKPFSMGRNLLCVYSKKHMHDIPELVEMKKRANTRSLKEMALLLSLALLAG